MPLKNCVGLDLRRCLADSATPQQQTRTNRRFNWKSETMTDYNGYWRKLHRRAEDSISPFPSHNSRGMTPRRLCWDSFYWIRASVVSCVTCLDCRSYIQRASVRRLAQGFSAATKQYDTGGRHDSVGDPQVCIIFSNCLFENGADA